MTRPLNHSLPVTADDGALLQSIYEYGDGMHSSPLESSADRLLALGLIRIDGTNMTYKLTAAGREELRKGGHR